MKIPTKKETSVEVVPTEKSMQPFFERTLASVREDIADNPYIQETFKVLPVGGYRSAIGSLWNAVVDDLRNKIMHRSLVLFNKAAGVGRDVKSYEDFQNFVNDDQLIEGAYKIGVIGWEASKILRHAKEIRHIFNGHPKSSEPSILRVLAMFDDCVKYVLIEPYPAQIVDIDDYVNTMDSAQFDRNTIAVANALTELPEIYKDELINRLFTVYVHPNTSSVLRSNVEFVIPVLWSVLPKEVKIKIVRRVDQEITKSNSGQTANAFAFVNIVGANAYLSATAKNYTLVPLVKKLKESLDDWDKESECVQALLPYAANIPVDLINEYVSCLTHTYVGFTGGSPQYSRSDFYSNRAAELIPKMFEVFDDTAALAFIETVKNGELLRKRIHSPSKLNRLRSLGNMVLSRVSASFSGRAFLENLVDENKIEDFINSLPALQKQS
jgi:hypothetical protein